MANCLFVPFPTQLSVFPSFFLCCLLHLPDHWEFHYLFLLLPSAICACFRNCRATYSPALQNHDNSLSTMVTLCHLLPVNKIFFISKQGPQQALTTCYWLVPSQFQSPLVHLPPWVALSSPFPLLVQTRAPTGGPFPTLMLLSSLKLEMAYCHPCMSSSVSVVTCSTSFSPETIGSLLNTSLILMLASMAICCIVWVVSLTGCLSSWRAYLVVY